MSARHRTVDTLARMTAAGTISAPMHEAGRGFETAFVLAGLDPLRAPRLLRIAGQGDGGTMDARAEAQRRVRAAVAALGGPDSPAGSCVWHVLGCGMSLREWALRQGWEGRPVRQEQAQGILIAALGVLATRRTDATCNVSIATPSAG